VSCHSNEKSIDLPSSINLLSPVEPLTEEDDLLRVSSCEDSDEDVEDMYDGYEVDVSMNGELGTTSKSLMEPSNRILSHPPPKLSITMPSSAVVEISQNFYWPLYSKPIDWIYQEHVLETCSPAQLEEKARKVAKELNDLGFFQSIENSNLDDAQVDNATVSPSFSEDAMIDRIISELLEEKEDWFSDLSGGQKSKVELVRKVFLHDHCPDVLLIDETLAPLDPASKSLVMSKLKQFCSDSIIIVIYHTDVGQGKEVEGKSVECVPANDFFDKNIHLEKGVVQVRGTC